MAFSLSCQVYGCPHVLCGGFWAWVSCHAQDFGLKVVCRRARTSGTVAGGRVSEEPDPACGGACASVASQPICFPCVGLCTLVDLEFGATVLEARIWVVRVTECSQPVCRFLYTFILFFNRLSSHGHALETDGMGRCAWAELKYTGIRLSPT